MPSVPAIRAPDVAYCTVTAIDGSGRLADRSPVRVLGWNAGSRIDVTVHGGIGRVRLAPDGRQSVTAHGYLRLPAGVRHLLGLGGGDRVLIAAQLEEDAALVYPMPVVVRLLPSFGATGKDAFP
jgi:bifunctional DNA-binding transcriptional regulator/antitoxin component of YhaV-PrlF toxin-antitoxin module